MPKLSDRQKRILTILAALIALALLVPWLYRITRPTQIAVIVRDSETSEFLGDVVVEVQNRNGQTIIQFVTKADGTAAVKRLPPDTEYRVVARRIDYVPAVRLNVPLELHQTTEVRIPLRPKPGGRLYVGLDQAYLASIDTASLLLEAYKRGPEGMRRWPARYLDVSPEHPWLYASARYVSYMLDPATMSAIAELTLPGNVIGLQLTPDGRHLLAALSAQGGMEVTVMDASTGAFEASVQVQPLLPAMDLLGQGPALLFVGDVLVAKTSDAWSAYALDEMLGPTAFGIDLRWQVISPDGEFLYVGQPAQDELVKVSLRTLRVEARWFVGPDIVAAAVHPYNQELYLVNGRLGLLIVLDTGSGEVQAQVPVGRGPVALVVDALGERVYVANGDSTDISVMDVATRTIIDRVELWRRPFALAVR